MRELDDMPSHTPVLARRQWLQNAFKPAEKTRAPAPGHDLVHQRLSWIEEQKRKSLETMGPNNKDASNIPEHLVEDRKKWLDDELRQMLKQTEENRRHSFPIRKVGSMGNLARGETRDYSDFRLVQSYSYDAHEKVAGGYIGGLGDTLPCSTTSTDTSDMTSSHYSSSIQEYTGFLQDGGDISFEGAVPLYFDHFTSNDRQRDTRQGHEDDIAFRIINIQNLDGEEANGTFKGPVQKQIQTRRGLNDMASPSSCLADYARHSAHTFSRVHLATGFPEDELVANSSSDILRTPPKKTKVPVEKTARVNKQKAAHSSKQTQPAEARCNCTIM